MATVSVGRSDALTSKILSEVAALARDQKPAALSLRLVTQASLPVALTVQHTATFAAVTAPGKGPLPQIVVALSSMSELQVQLDQRLEAVRHEAGDLIDKWVIEHGDAYRSVLPPERCMLDRPVLGVQEVCGDCHGRKELTCSGCGGRGRVTCGRCGGRGHVTCSSCGGSRQTRCLSCNGSGTHEVRDMDLSTTDRQNTMNQSMQMTRRVPCPGCGGRGSNPCSCFDGTQACSCSAGQVTCGRCGGKGIVPCDTCAATGAVHHTGRVQCTVNRGIRVEVGSGTAEDQQTFRDRVPFDQIGAMASETGGVRLQQRNRVGHQVTLDYSASIPLECAESTVRGDIVSIRAYGPSREIYDYHQLVAKLLEPDLAGLEKSLQGNSPFKTQPGSSLAPVTRKFLASELNALIAEAAPQIAGDGAVTPQRSASLARVIGQSLLLAPLVRTFRRSGMVFKGLMILVGLGLLSRPIPSYLLLALICSFYEWRYQRNLPPEAVAPRRVSNASASASERAANALQAPVASGMVNAQYVQRASAAIGKAVRRLYGPLILPMALWVTGGVTLLSVVAWQFVSSWTPVEELLTLLGLTGIAWFLLELRALSSLKGMLGPNLYERLKGQLGKTRNRYRVLPVAGFVVGVFLANFILRLIAHFRYGAALF